MKYRSLLLLALFGLLCTSQAQITRPLLGTKQNMESSAFCKKYKCTKMPPNIGLGYVLQLPGDEPWAEVKSFWGYDKNTAQLWSLARTVMFFDVDEKTKQLKHIEFQLRQNFRANNGTYGPETMMLADAIYHTLGVRLPPPFISLGEPYSFEIDTCFLKSRARPKENIEPLTRVMLRTNIMLETEKRQTKAWAVCSSRLEGSTEDKYMPTFKIEIIPERG